MRYTEVGHAWDVNDACLPHLGALLLAAPEGASLPDYDARVEFVNGRGFPQVNGRLSRYVKIDLMTTAAEIRERRSAGQTWTEAFAVRTAADEREGRRVATSANWQPWMGVDFGHDSGTGYLTVTSDGQTTTAPIVNLPKARQIGMSAILSTPRHEIVLSLGPVDVYENGHVATNLADEETARQIALDSGIDGDVTSDGTLRLGSVIVSASGGWDHPAAGDLDARSRRIWSLVGDCWASLPAWARRAR